MNLRKEARMKPCMVRAAGVCNWDPETTVLAHIRRSNTGGAGKKPSDLIAVWACSNCHDLIDRRNTMGGYTIAEIDGIILDALCRQLDRYVTEGVVRWD